MLDNSAVEVGLQAGEDVDQDLSEFECLALFDVFL